MSSSGRRLRVLTWNIRCGGHKAHARQLSAVRWLQPDLVALQEVTLSSVAAYREGLARAGLPFAVDSFEVAPHHRLFTGPRRYGQLTASRWPLANRSTSTFDVPWPERVLTTRVLVPGLVPLEIHNTHVPPGASNGRIKVEHLRGLWDGLVRATRRPRLLVGDLNTPRHEAPDGTIETWGEGDFEWDASELLVLIGLRQHGLYDSFRTLHGYRKAAYSIVMNGDARRRYDHVFASVHLKPLEANYLHRFRRAGLSDHAPLSVTFGIGPGGG